LSTIGSALLDTGPLDSAFADATSDSTAAARAGAYAPSTEALRRQVAERLAAHRSRRPHSQPALSPAASPSAPTRVSRIAAVVAHRYAHSLSYRAYLAAEAERATQQAQAAAQIAALNAQAVALAQQQLLDSLNEEALHHDSLNDEARDLAPHGPQPLNESPAQLPRELSLWPEAQLDPAPAPHTRSAESSRPVTPHSHPHHARAKSQSVAPALPGLTVRLFDDAAGLPIPLLSAAHRPLASSLAISSASHGARQEDHNDAEARRLDEEIAFRQSPVFEEPAGPPMPLPANLIEFPRQLVASRKARPRYAEGPLRTAADPAPGGSQLRIFEVDPEQISTTPVPAEAPAPQWTSIWLDTPEPEPAQTAGPSGFEIDHSALGPFAPNLPALGPLAGPSAHPAPLPQIASLARRIMATAIDAAILLAGFLAFTAAFILAAGRSISWHAAALPDASLSFDRHSAMARLSAHVAAQFTALTGLQPSLALAAGAFILALFYLLYQALFFSFSEATPGMRCARIGLCTFDDENPSRRAMRRRILAVLVSACPLGLGLLWATLDEDRLAWHDRLTRTYQRSY